MVYKVVELWIEKSSLVNIIHQSKRREANNVPADYHLKLRKDAFPPNHQRLFLQVKTRGM